MKDLKKEIEQKGLRPLETGIKYVLENGHYYLVSEGTGEKERLYFKSDLLEERKKTLEEVLYGLEEAQIVENSSFVLVKGMLSKLLKEGNERLKERNK